jgi:hypothetical protein
MLSRAIVLTPWLCHRNLKSILRQKKNYGNSNIFTMQKYNLQKNPLEGTKILQDIRTL